MFDFFQNYPLLFSALGAVFICVLFWVLSVVLGRLILPRIQKKLGQKNHPLLAPVLEGYRRPCAAFLKFAGVLLGILYLLAHLPNNSPYWLMRVASWLAPALHQTLRIGVVLAVAWGLLNTSKAYVHLLENAQTRFNARLGKSVSRFLGAIFNVVVVAFVAVIILNEFGYNVNSLITGLGLGGLTIALAAKDSAANFFGGLVLVIEKPFEIGDWVTFTDAGNAIEGTIEDINLRSTKIRTGPGSLTIVPNANISNAAITNWSSVMEKRRADFTIGVTYASKPQLEPFLIAVRAMLQSNADIVADSVMVRFSALGDSALQISVRFYTSLPGYNDHMRILEQVNLLLLQLAEEHKVTFAYPTSTVHLNIEEDA